MQLLNRNGSLAAAAMQCIPGKVNQLGLDDSNPELGTW
jgi:hypothetical protein